MKITNIERFILECIGERNIGINQIIFETKLSDRIIQNSLQRLIVKGFVKIKDESYSINFEKLEAVKSELNSPQNLYREIRPMVNQFLWNGINKKQSALFKMKKVCFDKKDEVIFKNLIAQLEDFIRDNNKMDSKNISSQKVFMCFFENYKDGISLLNT